MLNSNPEIEMPDLVFVENGENSPSNHAKPYDNVSWFFTKTKKTRQLFTEKGLLTFPFPFGYKMQNNEDRYGKKIIPMCKWKGVENINDLKPHLSSPHNYAIMTGPKNNILVIDYDFPKFNDGETDGLEWLKSIFPEEHDFWKTYRVKSGSGGQHFYFKYDDRIKCSGARCIYINGEKSTLSLDLRTDGGCVIGENSINEIGSYDKICGDIDNIMDLPEELITYLQKPKSTFNSIANSNKNRLLTTNNNSNPDNSIVDEEKLKYLALLDGEEHLFGDYDNWFFLAKLCANHYNFNLFWTISQKAPSQSGKKQNINDCRLQFENSKSHQLHFGAFVNFLKKNLQQKYDESFGYINKYIYQGDDEGFNQLLFHTYKDRFKFDPENEVWYECVNGIWVKRDKKNLKLRRLIAEDFIKIFKKRDYFLSQKLVELNEDTQKEEIKKIETLRKKLTSQIQMCRSNNKRAGFVNSNTDMFYDYDFMVKLDSPEISGNLFSFNNGYIDLNEYIKTKKITFHRHKADNYISMTCGYDYKPKSEIDETIYNYMDDLIKSILPDNDDYKWMLQALSSCMTACNQNEIVMCLYGRTGGNGKGVICTNIMKEVFGSYCGTYNTKSITGKSKESPENASSGLASIMRCRYVYMTEPEKDEEINNEAIKILSGGDEIQYRKLHENMIKAVPSFTIALQTNNILNCDCFDEAIWRRLKYIYFNQTFRTEPNLEKNEKQADTTIKEKLKNDVRYRQAFIHLLLDNYTDTLKDTPNIKKYTELSRNDNDTIKTFIDECVVSCNGETFENDNLSAYGKQKFITLNELKKEYHKYHQNNFDEGCPYKLKDLKSAFLSKIGDLYRPRYSTTIYARNYTNNEYEPVKTSTNREKKKNWSDVFIGYKMIDDEIEVDVNDNNPLDIEYAN